MCVPAATPAEPTGAALITLLHGDLQGPRDAGQTHSLTLTRYRDSGETLVVTLVVTAPDMASSTSLGRRGSGTVCVQGCDAYDPPAWQCCLERVAVATAQRVEHGGWTRNRSRASG